jgi:ABC-type transport system substrate-binding protein
MSIDRDLFLDTFAETQKFDAEGLPVEKYWSSSGYPGFGTYWWLDPQGKDFGANSKYYQFNIAEAKKLMSAAGYGSGFDAKAYRIQQPIYGPVHFQQVAVLNQMINAIGIRTTEVLQDYAKEYIPKNREGHGQYEGLGHSLAPAPANDAVSYFAGKYSSKGGTDFLGFDVNGKGDQSGDPKVDADIAKARREFDTEKRRSLIYDLQRYLGQKQYALSYPGVYTRYLLAWPVVRNFQVEQGDNQRSAPTPGRSSVTAFTTCGLTTRRRR